MHRRQHKNVKKTPAAKRNAKKSKVDDHTYADIDNDGEIGDETEFIEITANDTGSVPAGSLGGESSTESNTESHTESFSQEGQRF